MRKTSSFLDLSFQRKLGLYYKDAWVPRHIFTRLLRNHSLQIHKRLPHTVIPAQAGIQGVQETWIPAFAGMTSFHHARVYTQTWQFPLQDKSEDEIANRQLAA